MEEPAAVKLQVPGVPVREAGHERARVTHRLEAFSDIVIGFSLAQLGISLVLPAHALDLVQRPFGIVAFFVTFAVIVRFWWNHFRIFENYFEPTRVMMFFNFAALAGLILQVFALQAFLHFVPLGQGLVAARIYFGLFIFSYGMLCAMLLTGTWLRWKVLGAPLRLRGARSAIGMLCVVAGCWLGDAFTTHENDTVVVAVGHTQTLVAVLPATIITYTFIGWIVGFILGRLGPRIPAIARIFRGAPVTADS